MAVRPQRKFAVKQPDQQQYVVLEEPQEPELAMSAEPYVSTIREPVSNLIDEMAFKSIHEHQKAILRDMNRRVMRLVLERVSPPSKPAEQHLQKMVLRNRTILKQLTKSKNLRKQTKQKRLQSRRVSIEDNRPLIYYVKNKIVKRKRKNRSRKKKKEVHTYKTDTPHCRENHSFEQCATPRNVSVAEPTPFDEPNELNIKIVNSFSCKRSFTTSENTDNMGVEDMPPLRYSPSDDDINAAQGSNIEQSENAAEQVNESLIPSNPWSVFLRSTFDWTYDLESANVGDIYEQIPDQSAHDIAMANISEERVQEWLTNYTDQTSHTTEPVFKVPEPPRRKINQSLVRPSLSSIGSVRGSERIPLTHKEKLLRLSCTAWKSSRLADIITKPDYIQSFCMECTRCIVMFDSDRLDKLGPQPSGSLDVDAFASAEDNGFSIEAYRKRLEIKMRNIVQRKKTLVKISNQPDYRHKLKEVMSSKGRKILKVAILIRDDVNALSPRSKAIVEVITILLECNAARIDPDLLSASAHDSSESSEVPNLSTPVEFELEPTSHATTSGVDCERTSLMRKRPWNNDYDRQLAQRQYEGGLVKAPTFKLTVEEFSQCPVTFAYNLKQRNPDVSLCGIKPPGVFMPDCVINNPQTNFKARNHYIQRMMKRWSAGTRELVAIRSIQDPKIQTSPLFEGLELDLVKLYHSVQEERGIEACQKNVQKWEVIAHKMNLHYNSKKAYSKLENIYLKYLLNYNTLTNDERERTFVKIDMCWKGREAKAKVRVQVPLWRQEYMRAGRPLGDDEVLSLYERVCAEAEECVTSGRYVNLNTFKKMAGQVLKTYFPKTSSPDPDQVETKYWGIVTAASGHVCVHAGSVDATIHDVGFTRNVNDVYGKHLWNLKQLSKANSNNLLSYLESVHGVTSTTAHYGMLFSTSCWHRDPTCVPWIEYLHTGAPKIWYSVPPSQAKKMRDAVEKICPIAVQNKEIWLACDFVMIPPKLLRSYGVTVERHVQYAGEFVLVYPNSYTACIDTGFNISEGVYFAHEEWIRSIDTVFQILRMNAEPSLFCLEDMLMSITQQKNIPYTLLEQASTKLMPLLHSELNFRTRLVNYGVELITPENYLERNRRGSRAPWQIQKGDECAYCRCNLQLSKVVGVTTGKSSLCANHGALLIECALKRDHQTNAYCVIFFTKAQLSSMLNNLRERLASLAV